MQTLTVTGSLEERSADLVDVFSSGLATGFGSSLSIASDAFSGITLNGSGFSVTRSGDELLEGTVTRITLNEIVLGSSFAVIPRLEIDVARFDVGGLYTVTERTATTARGMFNPDYLADQLDELGWIVTGSGEADSIADTTLFSFDGDDRFTGGKGNDVIDGGKGIDTAVFDGNRSDYDFTVPDRVNAAITISGPDGTDRLTRIEAFEFDDGTVDIAGLRDQQGQEEEQRQQRLEDVQDIAALYEISLDRDGAIDLPGLNFWYDVLEQGSTKSEIAQLFLDAPEFEASFGDVSLLGDRELVQLFYRNTLDREGEDEGVDFWTGTLEQDNFGRADLLVAFADSEENRTGLDILDDLREVSLGEWDFGG